MTGFWICVGTQLWKGSEYSMIPNIPVFLICKGYTRFWICPNMAEVSRCALTTLNMHEYSRLWLDKQSSEYARILNVSDAVHSMRSLTSYWAVIEANVSRTLAQRIIPDCSWIGINMLKMLQQIFLATPGNEYTWSSYMFDRLLKISCALNKYARVLNMAVVCGRVTQFWICLTIWFNMPQYAWICLNMP